MKRFICIVASLVLPLTSPSWAKESAPLAETVPIHNVVDLAMQKCDGPAAILWNVHQKRAEIQRSGVVPLGNLGYRVNLMRIPDFREWTAAIRLHDHSRQVDDSYVLFTRTGYAPFDAGYVITRLPEDVPDAQHAFQIVIQLQRGNAGAGKVSLFTLKRLSDRAWRWLWVVGLGRCASPHHISVTQNLRRPLRSGSADSPSGTGI